MPVQHRHSLHASSISSESGPWRILRRNAPDRRGCDAVRCDPSPLSRTENTLKYDRNVLIRSNPPLEVFDPNSSVPSSPPHTSLGPKALQSTPWRSTGADLGLEAEHRLAVLERAGELQDLDPGTPFFLFLS